MDGTKRSQIRPYGEVATTEIALERTIRNVRCDVTASLR
jgi:hypothetical protein